MPATHSLRANVETKTNTLTTLTGRIVDFQAISQGWCLLFWAVFVAAMTGASLKLTRVLTVILVFVTWLELLLAIGSFTGVMFITRAGAACGCIAAAVVGLYLAAGLWNLTFGRTVLAVGEWKR